MGLSFKDSDMDGYKKYSEVFDMDKFTNLGSIYDDAISLESIVKCLVYSDLIVVDTQFKSKSCINKMIEAGLPVVFTDMVQIHSMEYKKVLSMLGEMLGQEDKVKNMVARCK